MKNKKFKTILLAMLIPTLFLFCGMIAGCSLFGENKSKMARANSEAQYVSTPALGANTSGAVYLDPTNGNNSNTGADTSNAVKTLEEAVNKAGANGFVVVMNTIEIMQSGTYDFGGITFERYYVDSSTYFTGNLFVLGDEDNATIDITFNNVTINGNAYDIWLGSVNSLIYSPNANLTINNSTLRNNRLRGNNPRGAGINCECNLYLYNTTFDKLSAGYGNDVSPAIARYGSGFYSSGSETLIESCMFGICPGYLGGFFYTTSQTVRINNSIFNNSSADFTQKGDYGYYDGCTEVLITNSTYYISNATGSSSVSPFLMCENVISFSIENCEIIRTSERADSYCAPFICSYGTHCADYVMKKCSFTSTNSKAVPTAIIHSGNNLTVEDCVFENSISQGYFSSLNYYGGAISFVGSGALNVSNCTFTNCSGTNGGAIYSTSAGDVAVNNCEFYSCSSTSNGGAVYAENYSSLTIFGCNFGDYTDANNNNIFDSGELTINVCTGDGIVYINTTGPTSFENCNFYRKNGRTIRALGSEATDGNLIFTNCNFGTYGSSGANNDDVRSDTSIIFNNCNFAGRGKQHGNVVASLNGRYSGDRNKYGITLNDCEINGYYSSEIFGNYTYGLCYIKINNCKIYNCRVGAYGLTNGFGIVVIENTEISDIEAVTSSQANMFYRSKEVRVINSEITNCTLKSLVDITYNPKITIKNSLFDTLTTEKDLLYSLRSGVQSFNDNLEVYLDSCVVSNITAPTFMTGGKNVVVKNCMFLNNTCSQAVIHSKITTTTDYSFTQEVSSKTYYNIVATEGSLLVDNCVFDGNTSSVMGGAILSSCATTTITNSTFANNSSANLGGAIVYQGASNGAETPITGVLTLTNCNFLSNTQTTNANINICPISTTVEADITSNSYAISGGGALAILGGQANIVGCNFGGYTDANNNNTWDSGETSLGNSATSNGGAINYTKISILTVQGTNFVCNSSTNSGNVSGGGAIAKTNVGSANQGTDEFTNCNFSYNTASSCGGAFNDRCEETNEKINFNSCNFTYNACFTSHYAYGGGAVFLSSFGPAHYFTNCNFTNNYSSSRGGAIINYGYTYLTNCIFQNNVANEYGAMGVYVFSLNRDVTILNNVSINSNSSTVCTTHYRSPYINGNNIIIKNNYTGANLVEDSSVLANPTNSSQKAKIVKSAAFNSSTGELTSTFASDTSILQGNLQIGNTSGSTINNAASSQNEIWLSSTMTTPTKIIATYNKGYKQDMSKILSNFHYDNNPGNIVFYIQDDKIYAKVLDTTSTSQIEYTASDFFGPYDSAPHGIDVKVYNLNEGDYSITYSLEENGTYTTEIPTLINAGVQTVYFKITDIRTGVTKYAEVSGSRTITINTQFVSFNYNNATLQGVNFGQTITYNNALNTIAGATKINQYLRGVTVTDLNGFPVAGSFYLSANYTPTATSYALPSTIIFIPDNPNYGVTSNTIGTNITPVFEFSELYYKSGNFYPTKADADSSTYGSGATTISNIINFLKPMGTIYFLDTYNVTNDETINIGSNNFTFSGYAASSSNFVANSLISVASGKTLTIIASDTSAKLVIKGIRETVSSTKLPESLLVNAGELTLTGNIEISNSNCSGATNKNGAGVRNTGTLNLTGVTFKNLTALLGGAVYSSSGTVTLTNCNFYSNSVSGSNCKGSAIYTLSKINLNNCNVINNDVYISASVVSNIDNCYITGSVVVEATTGGTLNLGGNCSISQISYYFYNGASYNFKITDNGLNLSSLIYLNPLNATKEENLIAVYSKYPSGAQTPFSLKTVITGLTLGRTTSGYLGLVSTQTSSSGSGGSTTPTTPTAPTKTSYTLTDFVDATTLQNTGFESDGTAIDTTTNNLTTTDLVWLPDGISGSETNITTMVRNIFAGTEFASESIENKRRALATDFAGTNSAGSGNVHYYLRSPLNATSVHYTHSAGYAPFNISPSYSMGIRPALQLSLNTILSAGSTLNIQINGTNKTIIVPNIMYPQTKVETDSALETALENAYNNGYYQNGIVPTGKIYYGYTTYGASRTPAQQSRQYAEFMFNTNYYARYTKDENGVAQTGKTWFQVEPIVWYITNWDDMPTSINPNGKGTATQILVLSQYVLNGFKYYPNESDNYRTLWQNSFARAFLNGYDLAEQNNGTNGNASYASAIQASFKGTGFIDTIWHDIPTLTVYFDPTSGADANNGLTETTPVKTIGGLNSVITNNPVLNTIAFKSTLTIDEAFITNNPSLVSGDTLTLDFGGRYLASFDDGTNSFTGNFFNVTATSKKVVITNFKVNGNLVNSTINSATGLRVQTASGTNVTLSNLDISNCTGRGLTVTGAITLIDSNIYENVIGVAGKNNGTSVPGSVYGMGASFNSNNVDGTTTILNCNFYGNVGGYSGTAIYVQGKATNQFVMENCKIFNNSHSYNYISGTVYTRIPATFTNCTFYNNRIGTAAGIYSTTEVTVNNCVFDSNNSWIYEGGAIRCGVLIANDCIFFNNRCASYGSGGAVYCSSLTATNCNFYNNTSAGTNGGGAIYSTGAATLTNCQVYGNTGGGVNCEGAFTATNCTFHDNTSTGEGGAIYSGGEVRINNSKLYNNSSFHNGNGWTGGGAILGGNAVLNNCELFNNSANSAYGGAIKCQALTATNSKFYNNTAMQGGAMKIDRALTITNCEIYDNYSSGHAGAIYHAGREEIAHYNYSKFYNNHSGGQGTVIFGTKIDVLGCQFYGNSYNPGVMHAYGVIGGGGGSVINITDSVFYNNKHSTGTVNGTNITLTNCNIFNNESNGFSGGGVYATGWVSATNCNIYNNTTVTHGGGIYAEGAVTVINSNIYNNLAKKNSDKHGGGIYSGGAVTLTNSNVYNNQASGNGGGLYATGGATLTNCNLYNNTSTGTDGGGAIYTTGAATLTNCQIYNNQATRGHGGGIRTGGELTLTNCQVYGNTSGTQGGGFYASSGSISNCNIYNNTAVSTGGGFLSGGHLSILNCNIYNNTSISASGGGFRATGFDVTVIACKIYNNTSSLGGGIYSDKTISLINCDIYNHATGGGIIVSSGASTLTNCNLYNNVGGRGGGVLSNGNLTLTNCNLYNNTATGTDGGGAIYTTGTLNLSDCNVFNNMATASGGGFFATISATLINCNVYNNTAKGSGGGLYSGSGGGATTLTNCNIAGNSSAGGTIHCLGNLEVNNSKIVNNTTTGSTGLISVTTTEGTTLQVTFTNVTFNGNFANNASSKIINVVALTSFEFTNCEVYNNVSGSSGSGNNFIVNNGGELNLNGCRFANNLIAEGSDYKFGGIYTSSGETTLTNCNFSYNLKDNQGASHSASTNGFVGSTDSGQTTNIYNTIFTNNNLGENGAVVSGSKILLNSVLFESNTGKLASLNDVDAFNIIISSNDFNGNNGLEILGEFNLYNIIVEDNTNGSSIAIGDEAFGLIEKLVADNNMAKHLSSNGGAVIKNQGALTLTSGNTMFMKYADLIFSRSIVVNPQSVLTNNSSFYGGAIYNLGTLNLKDVILGESSNGNSAHYGGAIYNGLGGNLTINNSTLNYNHANNGTGANALQGNGGAIYNLGNLTINSGSLSYNNATYGGAVYNLGLCTINGGDITYNTASYFGGAICNIEESLDTTGNGERDTTFKGTLVINDGSLSNNYLVQNTAFGGAIYNSAKLIVNNGTFIENESKYGGAIYALGKENYIYGGRYEGNMATYGGAFYAGTSSTLNVSNVYVVLDNTSNTWVYGGCCAMGEGEENNPVVVNFSNSHVTKKYNTGHNAIYSVFFIYEDEYDNLNLTSVVFDSIGYVEIITAYKNSNKNKTSKINITGCEFKNINRSVLSCTDYYSSINVVIKDSNFYNIDTALLIDVAAYQLRSTITNCTFENNRGSILRLSTATVDNCTFINNVGSYIIDLTNNATLCFASISNITATGNCVNSVINIKNRAYCNLLGTNIITNNYLSSTTGAVNISNISQHNSKPPLTFGFGGKLIVTDNNLLIEGTSSDYDVEINGIYYKNSNTESNLNIPSGLTILQNGLLSGSKIGLTIYSTEEDFDLSSLVGLELFSGSNITTKDFSAFYMDNNLGSLMLKDNKVYLASVGNLTTEDNSYTVLVSDLVFVVDGIYHELAQQDFVVFNEYGNKLNTSEYSVYYSLQKDGEYSSISPKFMGVGNNEVFYKVYAGLDNTSTQIGQGSTNLNIILKSMNLISAPTAYVAKGANLASASFKGGRVIDNLGNTVSGSWAFDSSVASTIPTNTATTYQILFTPTSSGNYGNNVSTSVPVTYKFDYLIYKEVSGVTGFYLQSGVYSGFRYLKDIAEFLGKGSTIDLQKTYVFETSETFAPKGDVYFVWSCTTSAFQVGSSLDITVEFAGNGYVYFNNKTIANESYLFDVSTASTLVLSNCLISNFLKTYASSSGISSLILNYGTLNLNGTNLISNSAVVSNKTNIIGGLIYNACVVNFNSGNIANNTLTNNTTNGNAYGTVVYNNGGKVNFNGTNFAVNSATGKSSGYGGIVYNANDGSVYVNSGVFSANSAGYGGVVANSDGSVVISGGTMQYNKATNSGAVLFTDATKQNNLIYYNGAVVTLETLSQLNNFNNAINATPVVYSNLLVLQVVIVVVSFALICLTFARVYVYKLKKK